MRGELAQHHQGGRIQVHGFLAASSNPAAKPFQA
jgi:hypothetical protein